MHIRLSLPLTSAHFHLLCIDASAFCQNGHDWRLSLLSLSQPCAACKSKSIMQEAA